MHFPTLLTTALVALGVTAQYHPYCFNNKSDCEASCIDPKCVYSSGFVGGWLEPYCCDGVWRIDPTKDGEDDGKVEGTE
ncbi:hypothetical protein E2P81_ATG00388 [Venturia nashicola]|nr:hypothetical protein E2P81_ATG00388 [Venturia nashicola]